jgi:hypothetical protein
MPPPVEPKIYHITHVDNLPSIIAGGGLLSDAAMIARGGPPQTIGMSDIKQARLTMPVLCHRGDFVGDYVPFTRRSLTAADRDQLFTLKAGLHQVVQWADGAGRRWAFTLSNARAAYTKFRASLDHLDQIDWGAVAATKWSGQGVPSEIKEAKQAEFLVRESFPWGLVSRIGVKSQQVYQQVREALNAAGHRPKVEIKPDWYY